MRALSQMQARYLIEEDRILLRMNNLADEEFRFWLTRRFTLRLWPALQKNLYASPAVAQQQSKVAKNTILQFEHENAASKATFDNGFREAKDFPLSQAPQLITRADITPLANGETQLTLFFGENKRSVKLGMSTDLLHLLCGLLNDAVEQSDWGLASLLPEVLAESLMSEARTIN